MQGYGWTMYDTRTGGSQTIHDSVLHVDLTTDFFKTKDGLSWSVRITGVPRPDAPANLKTALVFHVALEGNVTDQRDITCSNQGSQGSLQKSSVKCFGSVAELGPIELYEIGDVQNQIIQGPAMNSLSVAEDKIWQAKAVFTDAVNAASGNVMLIDRPGVGNMHFSQVVLEGPFSITYAFQSNAGVLLLRKLKVFAFIVEKGANLYAS
jgi:mannosyl-oligosaccharide glucosidase